MNKKILLVKPSSTYTSKLKESIELYGHSVDCSTSPIHAIALFAKKSYDLVISEYQMKEMDGIRLILILREMKPFFRSIMLSSYQSDEIEINTFDHGIDFYFNTNRSHVVLTTYIHKVLCKDTIEQNEQGYMLFSTKEAISIDTDKRLVFKEEKPIHVTNKEFELLSMFLEYKGSALSREIIAKRLWVTEVEDIDFRVIDGHVKRLRSKLNIQAISAIRSYGYIWNE
ncbi:OmpR family response regulator RpaB [Breznakia blatticola]|uniref:OmpR family response regulator RpaB n=1 Tax=Breznakia blatticola TaxID=1754012 RepID=A0A4R8A5R1_9FIRM|nr:response regulator transcription factor [Breznakia blatticola]TDW24858.1 OmpR family response regulator RpaB [Breznakia blatticola]